ncbi:MAG: glycosyltransferase, partial [Capsulimonadales bacterium]|nr:glycosyltransferase [Capsulimonadales bacterium]
MNPRSDHATGRAAGPRLRILQVASGMPNWGGAELHLVSLAAELAGRGHDVSVLCRPESFVESEARKRCLPVLHGLVRSQSDFGAYGRLLPVLRAGRFDVLHVHMFPDHLVPPLAARAAGVPVRVFTHHLPFPLKKGAWKRFLIRQVLFDRAIGVSESVRRVLIGSGMSDRKVVAIHHGTEVETFRQGLRDPSEVRAEWGVTPDRFLIGMVGRLTKEKGVDIFLEAIRRLDDDRVVAVILGDGELRPELERTARESGIGGRVVFAGFRADVNNAMNALDVHVLASTWAEPCAAVIQQAMALGKP